MRVFVAATFPTYILEKIEQITFYFKTQTPQSNLKWVETRRLHLTLKFLGEIPNETIDMVKTIITQSLVDSPAFEISIQGLGMFPNARQPRVIWLGITNSGPLIELHSILDQNLQRANIPLSSRRYSPHLTIARVRNQTNSEIACEIGNTLSKFKVASLGKFTINEVCLYQSVLSPSGPLYTRLFTVLLNKV